MTYNNQKRLVTIQDLSSMGRCSLTVALPIISACGIETCVIPTAVLSTHTGGFNGYTFCNLSSEITKIKDHWLTLNQDFDALYTGYLAKDQIDIVIDFIKAFKTDSNLLLVDPAMADNGKFYPGFDSEFAKEMRKLISLADIVVPNLTEAQLLLDLEVTTSYTKKDIAKILKELTALGPRYAIISGLSFKENVITVMCYDKVNDKISYLNNEKIEGSFHGAGDIFASTIVGCLLNDIELSTSCKIANMFVLESIKHTLEETDNEMKYGLHFEKALPYLIKAVSKETKKK